jgi:lipoate-protein ligase A
MVNQLIITFPEDIEAMHDYINKVISFVPTFYRKKIKNIRKLIDKLLTPQHANFIQLTLEQVSEIESNLFLIRDQITERIYEVKNKFKKRIEESTEFVQLMKLLKYRFT